MTGCSEDRRGGQGDSRWRGGGDMVGPAHRRGRSARDPSGLRRGIAGGDILGHELTQETKHIREGDQGLIFCIL